MHHQMPCIKINDLFAFRFVWICGILAQIFDDSMSFYANKTNFIWNSDATCTEHTHWRSKCNGANDQLLINIHWIQFFPLLTCFVFGTKTKDRKKSNPIPIFESKSIVNAMNTKQQKFQYLNWPLILNPLV